MRQKSIWISGRNICYIHWEYNKDRRLFVSSALLKGLSQGKGPLEWSISEALETWYLQPRPDSYVGHNSYVASAISGAKDPERTERLEKPALFAPPAVHQRRSQNRAYQTFIGVCPGNDRKTDCS